MERAPPRGTLAGDYAAALHLFATGSGLARSLAVAEPPFGTARRIRSRAIWAVALFAASIAPGIIGLGIATATDDQINTAQPLALLFWTVGMLFALWAAVPTLRYWDALPAQTRWLGTLPLLSVSLLLSVALVVPLLT